MICSLAIVASKVLRGLNVLFRRLARTQYLSMALLVYVRMHCVTFGLLLLLGVPTVTIYVVVLLRPGAFLVLASRQAIPFLESTFLAGLRRRIQDLHRFRSFSLGRTLAQRFPVSGRFQHVFRLRTFSKRFPAQNLFRTFVVQGCCACRHFVKN